MGSIHKINGLYYIDFHARGLLYSQVAGDSLEEAQKLLRQMEEKIAAGEALTVTRTIDLLDFFERFLAHAQEQYGLKTTKRFACVISDFSGFLEADFACIRQLTQLVPSVMESYKIHLARTKKAKAVNLTILLLRDILEFGIKLGFINDNPTVHVRLLPWPACRHKSTPRQAKAVRLFTQGTGLGKVAQLLKLPDIARAIYFANVIPLKREDIV